MKSFAEILPTSVARGIAAILCTAVFVVTTAPTSQGVVVGRCLVASGAAAASCVRQYAAALGACRNHADGACEAALRAPAGRLTELLAATEAPVRQSCTVEAADEITFLRGLDDLVSRTAEACRKWGEDFAAVAYTEDLGALTSEELACQRVVGGWLARLHHKVVQTWGRHCHAAEFRGLSCRRRWRDRQLARLREAAGARIESACGAAFDTLGLVSPAASATLAGRIDALMDVVVGRARHLAERVYPPLNLGPSGLFGPAPVGVRTFDLVDPLRMNTAGTGPRPLRVEVYHPSTAAAVSGVERDALAPTYRNVARAPGSFPLLLFSPGQGSAPSLYAYLAAHLASHGFLVAGITHDGDLNDPRIADNRPLDLRVVLDQLLALNGEPGSFFQNAIDASRIGALGHSLGAYTVMALATCSVPATFDARVKAILPIELSVQFFSTQAPGIFSTIPIPTLLVGASQSRLAPLIQAASDALTPGPAVTAYANLIDALHNTFTDLCEVSETSFAECGPEVLPWRYARHITNYLALNFFDATLNGNAEALARLDPEVLASIDEMTHQSKAADDPGDAMCTLPCGDGTVGSSEACDSPAEQGACDAGEVCNPNCTACIDCADATVIPAEGGVFAGTTVGGSAALNSSCGNDVFAPERVFRWTPSVSHVATIQTCGGTTDYRTTLYVREGSCLGPEMACNQRGCGEHSRLTLPVVAGTTYFIVVDGFLADAGNFTLSVSCGDVPTGAACTMD